jgi:dihydrolipoamide dehydrogenase
MKQYDLIVIGTGSVMDIVDVVIQNNQRMKVAVIDKDELGGICLTRGCIPSKMLMYSAELVRMIERAGEFGINTVVVRTDFEKVMERMRTIIYRDINAIQKGLAQYENIDYFPTTAEFISPYMLKAGDNTITSKMIFLCIGSKPVTPKIKGLEETGYLTSDTLLRLNRLPESIAIVGGGYIAAEYGHFFSAMGSKVTIIGRNPQFLPDEETEVSALAKRELQKNMRIFTNHEVREAEKQSTGTKKIVADNRENGKQIEITAEEILVASGRGPNTDILHPERGGIKTDKDGWIVVDEYLETSQPNVWALGDADGKYPFKHKANYEAQIVYYNAILKQRVKADFHAVPHAVFMYPEVASVGLREKEALEKFGEENVLIGMHRYQDTAKGEAMDVKDYFVKVIVEKGTMKILGAHIIGPHASVLIQEIVNMMYVPEQSATPIIQAMHIHPALSEVVQKAFDSLASPEVYHHVLEHHYKLTLK